MPTGYPVSTDFNSSGTISSDMNTIPIVKTTIDEERILATTNGILTNTTGEISTATSSASFEEITTLNESIASTNGTTMVPTSGGLPIELMAFQYTPCGYCDTKCIYYALETLFVLGVFANAIVLFRVFRDKHLRNPTFTAIAACALADMCFLILNLTRAFETVILTVTCNYPSKVFGNAYLITKSIFWFSANGHVAFLAVLRYVCLTYPLKSNAYLSIRRVVLLSGCVWLLGLLIMGALTIIIFFTDFMGGGESREFQLYFWTTTYLMPLVTTTTLHLVKVYKVKKMTSETATESTKRLLRTMSRMVIMVVILATALPFPYILDRCLRSFDTNIYGSALVTEHFSRISGLLVLLNHSINPIMYAFVSEPFRMSLKRMLRLDRNAADDNIVTTLTSISEIQKRERILQRMED